jgi:hypothetical protein
MPGPFWVDLSNKHLFQVMKKIVMAYVILLSLKPSLALSFFALSQFLSLHDLEYS